VRKSYKNFHENTSDGLAIDTRLGGGGERERERRKDRKKEMKRFFVFFVLNFYFANKNPENKDEY
jgi:hypothetical protein